MGAENISKEPLKTAQVTGQTEIDSKENMKMKTETKCDCGYFSDSTDEKMICHQHEQGVVGEEVVIESTDGHEVGGVQLIKNKKQIDKQTNNLS